VSELAGADGPASTSREGPLRGRRPGGGSPSLRSRVVGDRGDPVVEVRRQAFAALLDDRPAKVAQLAAASSIPRAEVEQALASLEAKGALEVDGDGRVIGAHGLTRRGTRHEIVTGQRRWHAWCALDAVGIPVALGLDAEVRTVCPACKLEIRLRVHRGAVNSTAGVPVLWLPGGPCGHVMDDFCASANLFCSAEHLDTWRRGAADPPGQPLTLEETADEGRRVWADVAERATS
jgi:alkylmercury lyase